MLEGKVEELQRRIGSGKSVCRELLVLSGGDIDMAERASKQSFGLDQCKACIIDMRFSKLEEKIDQR